MCLKPHGQTAGALGAHNAPGLAASPHVAPSKNGFVYAANGNSTLFAHSKGWNAPRVQDASAATQEDHCWVVVQVKTARSAASLHLV